MKIQLFILSALGTFAIAAAEAPDPAELTATRCLICHGNFVPGKGPLAPPFAMVKRHYESLDEKTFIKTVSAWIKEPEKQKSRMPGAINRFGLMPALAYPDAEVTAIARYIYQTDFAMPGHGGGGMGRGKSAAAATDAGQGCEDECGPGGTAASKTVGQADAEKAAPAVPKWPIPAAMMAHLTSLEKDINAFSSIAAEDHANLAKRIDKQTDELISSCTMDGEAHNALHEWLMPFLELAQQHAESADPAIQQEKVLEMRRAFTAFHKRFEPAPQP